MIDGVRNQIETSQNYRCKRAYSKLATENETMHEYESFIRPNLNMDLATLESNNHDHVRVITDGVVREAPVDAKQMFNNPD